MLQGGFSHTEVYTARLIYLPAAEPPVASTPREQDPVPGIGDQPDLLHSALRFGQSQERPAP